MPVFGVRRDCRATREGKESEFFWFSSADRGDCADRVSRGDPHRQSGRHHGQAPAAGFSERRAHKAGRGEHRAAAAVFGGRER